jgi:hypothetical protein
MALTHVVPNGVDGLSGRYAHPPVPVAEIARAARAAGARPPVTTRAGAARPLDFADTGWGVVFPRNVSGDIRQALGELLLYRREQAGVRFRELLYIPGDTKEGFLLRHRRGPGPADPQELPYYLLLVGGPQEIPFPFQYQLDIQYAVGRIAFETPAEYAAYARSVVKLEGQRPFRPRKAALFAPQHPDDAITRTCLDHLVRPLAGRLRSRLQGWELQTFFHDEATKERLGGLLGGGETPDLLFTASHGLAFPSDDPRQRQNQGALLCQGWPGPVQGHGKPVERDWYLSGEDLDQAEACLPGLLCFHLACFSAGTPREGSASRLPGRAGTLAAPQDFLAALPLRLLARGATAVIGHVDTLWEDSLLWQGMGSQVPAFEKTLVELLLNGFPVGEAMRYFGERYAEIAADLLDRLEQERWGEGCDDEALAALWLASLDARSYVVLGDPAVHLPA